MLCLFLSVLYKCNKKGDRKMSMVLCFFGIENMKINCWEVEECKNAIQLSECCCIIANSHFDLCQYKQPVTRLQSHDLCNSLQMSQCP